MERCQRLADGINCLALSGSGAILAVCPNSSDIMLFEQREPSSNWEQVQVLKGHDQLVSGLDWHGDDCLLSCSHDRNAYVWRRSGGGQLKPELVITKLSRSCLCCQWSPGGKKIAIGSGEGSVCVASWDGTRELWAPRTIKGKHTSSVTAVAWHPSGAVLATMSTGSRMRIFDATISGEETNSTIEGTDVSFVSPANAMFHASHIYPFLDYSKPLMASKASRP